MSTARILVVEDDRDIGNLLVEAFELQGYTVNVAENGQDALTMTKKQIPDLILLDIMLPGMDGYEVCRHLRTTPRTSHIPIFFLTQKGEQSDKITGLELGADDYVTKPFDVTELILRAKNAIQSYKRTNLTDPRTGLPASRLIEEQLRRLINTDGWSYVDIHIEHSRPFTEAYGFLAFDEVLRYTAILIKETVDELGGDHDFIGHADSQTFVLISHQPNIDKITQEIQQRFAAGVSAHYSFVDTDRGGIEIADGDVAPMMNLSCAIVPSDEHSYSDIREITQAAAELQAQWRYDLSS